MPVGGDVISYKKSIYNRVNDSDVKVTFTSGVIGKYPKNDRIRTAI